MKLVFFSVVLNQHQAPVADELWELTGHQYAFVELTNLSDTKGGTEDYSKRPYLIRAWENQDSFQKAMNLAKHADCCVFGGVDALPFQKERMRLGLFSFDMSERWLKKGWKSFASPRLHKWLSAYFLGGWGRKPLYKLCMSGFAADDHYKLGTFRGKCYKWGYFTEVNSSVILGNNLIKRLPESQHTKIKPENKIFHLMWCARFLKWKHPELAVCLAKRLKDRGFQFILDMYGDGECRHQIESMVHELDLRENVTIHGNQPNEIVREAMEQSDIFLFTSDRYEGWGAVANESMSCGCVLVASDAIGSTPYLVSDGVNGCVFSSPSSSSSFDNPDQNALESLTDKVTLLFDDRKCMCEIQQNAIHTMRSLWNPKQAAVNLLQLITDLKNEMDTSIFEGPCSKA